MPDIESLMQEWPSEFEELLKEAGLPTADTDCDLPTYVDMVCGECHFYVNANWINKEAAIGKASMTFFYTYDILFIRGSLYFPLFSHS